MILGNSFPHEQGIVALGERWDKTYDKSADVAPNGDNGPNKQTHNGYKDIPTPAGEKGSPNPDTDEALWRDNVGLVHLLPPELVKILDVL
jgi:hypothetical protein